jgi:hypothetical protein
MSSCLSAVTMKCAAVGHLLSLTYSGSRVTFNLHSLGNEPVFSQWFAYSWSLHISLLSFHIFTCELAYTQELFLIPDGSFVQKLDW